MGAIVPIICASLILQVLGARYDERQTGETNVRVDIQDLGVVVLLDSEMMGGDDYQYDYSDLTVKPEKPSASTLSPPPLNASDLWTTNSTTTASTESLVNSSTTTISPQQHPLNTQELQIPVVIITDSPRKEYVSSSLIRQQSNDDSLPKRKCMSGFFLDSRNRCKKYVQRERVPLPNGLHYAKRPSDSTKSEP